MLPECENGGDTGQGSTAPWLGVSVGWSIIHTLKGCEFGSQSGHMPRLPPMGARVAGNQSMFPSHINVSLFLFLPSSLSKKSINISLSKD